MPKIKFSYSPTRAGRIHAIDEDDIMILLDRLPEETYKRLRAVHFNDRGRGVRTLGYVTGGRREIGICAVPENVSLARYLHRKQSPRTFGAVRAKQWPRLAVRRFMLYDVFLHELGHLQIVNPEAKSENRKFASQTKAQEFADTWRKRLWSEDFDHPDPVHNRPAPDEFEELESQNG